MAINLFQNAQSGNLSYNGKVEGSYRAEFKQLQISCYPQEIDTLYSTNLMMQQEYKGMVYIISIKSLFQVRLEDYYLIRSKQIRDQHKVQLERAGRGNCFNLNLITQTKDLKVPSFEKLNNAWNSGTNQGSQPNAYLPQAPNNLFNAGPTNNIFNNQQPISTQPIQQSPFNLFSNQNTQGQNNQQNNYLQNQSNIFQNQNQNQNLFQQPNSQGNNFFNQPQQNNLFNQPQQNNLFNQQQQNLFTQPQQTNIFNQPQSNNLFGQTQSFNIFNTPQNSQLSNNLFQNQFNNQYPPFQSGPYFQAPMSPNINSDIAPLKQLVHNLQSYAQLLDTQFSDQTTQLLSNQIDQLIEESRQQPEQFFCYQSEKKVQRKKQPKKIEKVLHSSKSTALSTVKSSNQKQFHQSSHQQQQISNFEDGVTPKAISYNYFEIRIMFLESEKEISLYEEFICKIRVRDLRLFVENHITHIDVFGNLEQDYFSHCKILNESNQLLQDQQSIENCQNVRFQYFIRTIPKLNKQGYQCNVPFNEIFDYSSVQDFVVKNQFGILKWVSPCNILFMDLGKAINISQDSVSLYDPEIFHELLTPDAGHKLNKECEITFYLKENELISDAVAFERNLVRQANKMGLQFINFNPENRAYTVKADHFSAYHFNTTTSDAQ